MVRGYRPRPRRAARRPVHHRRLQERLRARQFRGGTGSHRPRPL